MNELSYGDTLTSYENVKLESLRSKLEAIAKSRAAIKESLETLHVYMDQAELTETFKKDDINTAWDIFDKLDDYLYLLEQDLEKQIEVKE